MRRRPTIQRHTSWAVALTARGVYSVSFGVPMFTFSRDPERDPSLHPHTKGTQRSFMQR